MNWQVHGEWRMRVHEQLLIYQIRGAWNEEGAKAFTRDCGRIGKPLFGRPWAVLGDLRQWELATMDCIPVIRKLALASKPLGCFMQVMLPGESELHRDCVTRMVPVDEDYALHFARDAEHAGRILAEAGMVEVGEEVRRIGFTGLLEAAERRHAGSAETSD